MNDAFRHSNTNTLFLWNATVLVLWKTLICLRAVNKVILYKYLKIKTRHSSTSAVVPSYPAGSTAKAPRLNQNLSPIWTSTVQKIPKVQDHFALPKKHSLKICVNLSHQKLYTIHLNTTAGTVWHIKHFRIKIKLTCLMWLTEFVFMWKIWSLTKKLQSGNFIY